MSHACPTCGHAIEEVPMHALKDAKLTPQQRVMIAELVSAYPRYISRDGLFDALYQLDPNGGPEDVRTNIAVRISNIRRALAPYGWTVSKQGFGSSGRYRLEKISEDERRKRVAA